MSAKLLHALSDENPDLHKQIGCMTGIFQLFDRHHIITPKRITSYNSHKKPPSGNSHYSNGNHGDEYHNSSKEKISSKNVTDNHRISMESARASFSSSTCSSSFSSECNRTAQPQPETSLFDKAIITELASREPSSKQADGSAQSRKSSDFRDVVKDSIYKDARSLSVKTTAKEEPVSRVMKHQDSPRPLHLSRFDRSSEREVTKLQDTPRYHHDTREPARSSYEARERSSFSVPKDTPRFSYDGRETSRSSFESRDTLKSSTKLRELPRLSLDSRASSIRGSDSEAKSNSFLKDFQRGGGNSGVTLSIQQGLDTHKQNHSVVAKLMGLEAMPKPSTEDPLSWASRTTNDCKQSSSSPRLVSPRLRNLDSAMKPLPIEPAPWRQSDAGQGAPKPVFRSRDSPPKGPTASPSVYAEIEKRLKELEFKQSDKDLRALKQILDAMQSKGLLESKKREEQVFISERSYDDQNQNPRFERRSPITVHPVSSTTKGASSPRAYDSPIVIMKPANFIEKSSVSASSVIPIESISGLRKIRSGNSMDSKKSSVNSRMTRDLTPRLSPRESIKQPLSSIDKKANTKNIRSSSKSPTRSPQLPRENTLSSGRSTGSVSPRLQPKKLDLEKRSRPQSPSSDLSKPRKNSLGGSPGGKRRPRSLSMQQTDDQSSDNSVDMRNMSHQGDEASLRSDSNISLTSQIDVEVTSADRSGDISAFFHQGGRSPTRKVTTNIISCSKQQKLSARPSEDGSATEFMTVAPEQPSPVSVLDASFYSDDLPSPERKILEPFKVDDILNSEGMARDGTCNNLSPEIDRKKLENVEQLVEKLRRLNSNHDEASTDYIASLCDNTNPDHRYISEILLASGLLLRDLGSGLNTIQLHKSGHPINPDLFFVLEQTKASNGFSKDRHCHEKVHRKLVFDSVNEILETKATSTELCQRADKLAGRKLNGQRLLKELCLEVEMLQSNENIDWSFEDADDFLKTILCKDVASQTEQWTDFRVENSGLVLDIERSIFKDLIDEIISGEASGLRTKQGRRCRQLFAK